jgi:uncharacterized protein YjcR
VARNPDKKRCKAKNRQGEQCKNWAKPGYDVCHYHGAGGGAPPGNKNALKTGEHETIWMDTLDDQERVLFNVIDTGLLEQIDNEIRLLEIRERRMLQRIKKVMDGWEEDDIESKFELRKKKKSAVPIFNENGEMQMAPTLEDGMVEVERTTKKRSKLERIVAIEEALTRVQEKKAKFLELKHKIMLQLDKDSGGEGLLKELADVIEQSYKMLGDSQ